VASIVEYRAGELMFVRKVSTQNVIVENPTSDPPANEAVYPIISQMERAAGFAHNDAAPISLSFWLVTALKRA